MEAIDNKMKSILDDYSMLFENPSVIFNLDDKLSKSYIPDRIIARDKEILEIAANLKPIVRHSSPINMFIWGGSGVGKTITINHVLNTLSIGSRLKNKKIIIDFVKINCSISKTDTAVCLQILSYFSSMYKPSIKKGHLTRGQSIDYYLNQIWDFIRERASICESYAFILFFDEIDKYNDNKKRLKDEKAQITLLYDFTRAHENKRIDSNNCFIGVIAASNKMEFLTTLETSITSSAGFNYMQFPDYNEENLYQILIDRIDAFKPDVISGNLIRYVAKDVAERYNGDARKALDILKIAGKLAEDNHQTMITLDNIIEADKHIGVLATGEMIRNFSEHDKYLLLSIYLCEKYSIVPTTGMVYKIYTAICKILKAKTTSLGHNSRRITELYEKQILDIEKGSKGNTRIVKLRTTISNNIENIYTPELKILIENQISDIELILNPAIRNKSGKPSISDF
jgi:archaeal cell division control protein 6